MKLTKGNVTKFMNKNYILNKRDIIKLNPKTAELTPYQALCQTFGDMPLSEFTSYAANWFKKFK